MRKMILAALAAASTVCGGLLGVSPASAAVAPRFSVSCAAATEGQPVACTITKSAKASSYSKVAFETHSNSAKPGVDYVYTKVTVTFANSQLTAPVNVPTIANSIVDGTRSFNAVITAVRFAAIATGQAAAAILDDDVAAPPPPPPQAMPGMALALSACLALNRPESIVVGQMYDVAGFGGWTQPGDPAPAPGTRDIVILSDAAHRGDGWFALYVPLGCVTLG